MLDVDQNYGTPETPKPFPTFKECVAQDVQNVIFNSNEFAEERYIDDKLMLCITQHPGVLDVRALEGGAKQSFDQVCTRRPAVFCEAEGLRPDRG